MLRVAVCVAKRLEQRANPKSMLTHPRTRTPTIAPALISTPIHTHVRMRTYARALAGFAVSPNVILIMRIVHGLAQLSAYPTQSHLLTTPGHPPTHSRADDAQVTLSIENADGTTTPSGWSTRKENGGNGTSSCAPC
jgi:hypothetical protein